MAAASETEPTFEIGRLVINATDILTDLCIRGEVAPGEYVIELFW